MLKKCKITEKLKENEQAAPIIISLFLAFNLGLAALVFSYDTFVRPSLLFVAPLLGGSDADAAAAGGAAPSGAVGGKREEGRKGKVDIELEPLVARHVRLVDSSAGAGKI